MPPHLRGVSHTQRKGYSQSMGEQALYDRILRSLHRAAFDATGWPGTAGLIDVTCGLKGNGLVFAGGRPQQDVEIYFAQFCFRGQRREDFEHRYFRDYWFRDERIPRLRRLPDSQLVLASDLYTETEKKNARDVVTRRPRRRAGLGN